MLALRSSCEHCNKALSPDSLEARICSNECTFCNDCVETVLHNVCPNCGVGFCQRPIRPAQHWESDNYLAEDPATNKVTYSPVDVKTHQVFSQELKHLAPENR